MLVDFEWLSWESFGFIGFFEDKFGSELSWEMCINFAEIVSIDIEDMETGCTK